MELQGLQQPSSLFNGCINQVNRQYQSRLTRAAVVLTNEDEDVEEQEYY